MLITRLAAAAARSLVRTTSSSATQQMAFRSSSDFMYSRAATASTLPRHDSVLVARKLLPTVAKNSNSFSSSTSEGSIKEDQHDDSAENGNKDNEEAKTAPETTINLVPEILEREVGDGITEEISDEEMENVDRSHYTTEIKFNMPDMNSDGVVRKWYKNTGDLIKRGDVLCDIELESFTFEMDSDDEGITIMGPILVEENSEPVKPGAHLATILHRDDEYKKKKKGS